jgi:hypothetical protein
MASPLDASISGLDGSMLKDLFKLISASLYLPRAANALPFIAHAKELFELICRDLLLQLRASLYLPRKSSASALLDQDIA